MTTRKTKEQQHLHIIESVDTLLYHKGFNNMSFSDISEVTGVSKGNLYYYFRTKEDVLTAVIDHRIEIMKQMLSEWEQTLPTPIARLKRYVKIAINESTNVIQYGCPMGSLNVELAKAQPQLQKISRRQFDVFKKWLIPQMKLLSPNINAETLTLSLMARTQGVVVMSQVYNDKKLISRECELINQWLEKIC